MSFRRACRGLVCTCAITITAFGWISIANATQTTAGTETSAPAAPTEATLGIPIYPTATYLTSYDAGLGQRYYLFGTQASFETMVRYYVTVLDERGDRVFDAPAVHLFEVGRFREKTMAFAPGVTVKDYMWNGSEGYLDPRPTGSHERFPTIIQIVALPADQRRR